MLDFYTVCFAHSIDMHFIIQLNMIKLDELCPPFQNPGPAPDLIGIFKDISSCFNFRS